MLFRTIGFTGTRNGMTSEQRTVVEKILRRLEPEWVVHGDCIGADGNFHDIAIRLRSYSDDKYRIRLRPCDLSARAWCEGGDDVTPVKKPLVRNGDIVADADLQIGTPSTHKEVMRSGTWATIRRARKSGTPLVIVWPDGTVSWENFENVRK
jgi:hypothetical protein